MSRFEGVTWFFKPTFIGKLIYWSSSSSEVSMTASFNLEKNCIEWILLFDGKSY